MHDHAVDPGRHDLGGADLRGVPDERVAVEHDEVRHLPRCEGAGVVAVVHPRRPAGVRRERGLEVEGLPGQELMRDTGRFLFFFAPEVEVVS